MYKALLIGLVFLANIHTNAKSHFYLQAYNENLACHRTKFGPTTTVAEKMYIPVQKVKSKKHPIFPIEHEVTHQLYELLVDLKIYHEMTEFIPGYTIQAYTGANRQLAFQIKDKLCILYPHLNSEVQYKQPNFTVRIGRFLERSESYQLYVRIKKDLPQAIIRPALFSNKIDTFNAVENICSTDGAQDLENRETLLDGNSSHEILPNAEADLENNED